MKKAIELIRVSTEGQAASDRASIPAQRAVNRQTCSRYDLEIVRSIEIADVSGAQVLLAPEMQELVKLMQSPEIHGVVAREFSRLMRPENFGDYALLQAFVDSRTVLYLPEGPLDLNSKTGRLMGTIRAAIAGLERSEILERIWTAKEEKRRAGKCPQSKITLPFGVGYEEAQGFFYKPEAERIREAFRRFLAGEQSYLQLSKLVGVTPRGMHVIMRNPIWMGMRVIDKKRDSSPAGRYESKNGRQAGRRKIARAEEEIIRVRVISEPLISEADFAATQRIMDLKQSRHWRSVPDRENRFTYNGFVICSSCGEPVHTAFCRRDYYRCSGRFIKKACRAPYMDRIELEAVLDSLFGLHLASPAFLQNCLLELRARSHKSGGSRIAKLTADIESLRQKRQRVLDGFFEGVIDRGERDGRTQQIDRDIRLTQDRLMAENPAQAFDESALIESFTPLLEWKFWTRDHKRSVLAALVPEIRVAAYKIERLGLNAAIFGSRETRSAAGNFANDNPLLYFPISAVSHA